MNDPRTTKPKPQSAPTIARPPQADAPLADGSSSNAAYSDAPAAMSGDSGQDAATIQNPLNAGGRQVGVPTRLDKYTVIRRIGEGGMGLVFLGEHPVSGSPIAIKTIRPEYAHDDRSVHRFLTEARHMSRLSHPNLLKVMDVSDGPGSPYYVMPFMERGSLAKLLAPGKPLAVPLTIQIALEIASGLTHAHEKGIIHRDLKPANVLLDEGGHACLSDFGLVRTVFNDSIVDVRQSQCEGTAVYMSPGVANGAAEDTRCDIYAFGVMLYEMLTGLLAYQGISSRDVIEKVKAGPPASILSRNPSAHPGLTKIAQGAMARELRDRYSTMADVLADLKSVELGKHPLGPHGTGRRGISRGVLLVAVICVIAAGVGFAAYVRFFSSQSQVATGQPGSPSNQLSQSNLPQNSSFVQPAGKPPTETNPPAVRILPPVTDTGSSHAVDPIPDKVKTVEVKTIEPVDADDRRGTDLLYMKMIDPKRDAWNGNWTLDANGLTVTPSGDRKGSMMLAIPFTPPEEYDFRIEFTREGDSGEVHQILASGPARFDYGIDTGGENNGDAAAVVKHLLGFHQIVGTPFGPLNSATVPMPMLMPGKHISVVKVRRDSYSATLDGKPVANWNTKGREQLMPWYAWDLGRPVLGLGATGKVVFSSIIVKEITGSLNPVPTQLPDPNGLTFPRAMGNAASIAMSKDNSLVLLCGSAGAGWGASLGAGLRYDEFGYSSGDDFGSSGVLAALSPSGRLCGVSGSPGSVREIGGLSVLPSTEFTPITFSFSDDDRRVAMLMRRGENTSQPILRVYDLPKKDFRITPREPNARGESAPPTLSPDGNILLWCRETDTLLLCDLSARTELHKIKLPDTKQHWTATFSPDSNLLMLTSDGDSPARLISVKSGDELYTNQQNIVFAAFTSDSNHLILATKQGELLPVDIRDLSHPKEEHRFPAPVGGIHGIALSRDGRHLLIGEGDQKLHLLDAGTFNQIIAFTGFNAPIVAVAFSPDGTLALSTCEDHCVRIFKVRDKN